MFTLANIGMPSQPSQRQRSRKACQPCRQRKRKCDGRVPCRTCVRYDYDCFYAASERGSSGVPFAPKPGHPYGSHQYTGTPPTSSDASPETKGQPGILDPFKSRYVSASSAVAFPRLLGLDLGSSNAPRLHSFAWNLGVRSEPRVENVDFTSYLGFSELERLAEVYFQVIHPIFNFIDRDVFKDLCRLRYSQKSQKPDVDPIICGVAALGSLYSIGTKQSSHCHESELVELAKNSLEQSSILSSPTQNHVTAWVLRTIYLRSTTRPHASWISSCTTMHIAEATGLHQDVSSISIVSPAAPEMGSSESEVRRRLFWVAWSLNTILSYEYGRSRVDLANINVQAIDSEDGTTASQYITLATILAGDDLDMHDAESARALYKSLSAINALETDSNEIILFKADLAFCIYRRLRLSQGTGAGVSNAAASLVIQIGLDALSASSDLAAQHLPWWTVISVPFQLLCVLLAIDSRESLSHVGEAMGALEEVGRCWDTHLVREAVGSASFLVKLSRKRKEEDIRQLGNSMPKNSGPHGHLGDTSNQRTANYNKKTLDVGDMAMPEPGPTSEGQSASVQGIAMPENIGWIDCSDGEEPPLPDNFAIDWNSFFNTLDWFER